MEIGEEGEPWIRRTSWWSAIEVDPFTSPRVCDNLVGNRRRPRSKHQSVSEIANCECVKQRQFLVLLCCAQWLEDEEDRKKVVHSHQSLGHRVIIIITVIIIGELFASGRTDPYEIINPLRQYGTSELYLFIVIYLQCESLHCCVIICGKWGCHSLVQLKWGEAEKRLLQ